jgi:malate dehydrogenase (oxaloacetate-decarboxylating)(NADP+)
MEQVRAKEKDIDKYSLLQTLQDGSEALYYAMLMRHTRECMPLVYTPTVGQACTDWHKIYRHTPRGLYISLDDLGHVKEALENWPQKNVQCIVVTDGERILGLGDLGSNGMGIPVGKLALYTACGGIPPQTCLPVQLDTGTDNRSLREHPAYFGLRRPRERGPAYDALVKEFIESVHEVYGRTTLVQFEDFGNQNAFRILEEYQDKATCFNDDIQGTAAVALAGLIASEQLTNTPLAKHTVLFYGAGEAGAGIADLIAARIVEETGVSLEAARSKIYMMDSKGLVTSSRPDELAHHKVPYAHAAADCKTLEECVDQLKPSALIGVAAVGQAFTNPILKKMAAINKAPVIFALSNPTSKAECTAEEAYTATEGRCVFASGSPFDNVQLTQPDGSVKTFRPGQGNNAYVFPGLGLGALAAKATKIDDSCLLTAAATLAAEVDAESLAAGSLYPPLSRLRDVSVSIAVRVARHLHEKGHAGGDLPADMEAHVRSLMYDPFAA